MFFRTVSEMKRRIQDGDENTRELLYLKMDRNETKE